MLYLKRAYEKASKQDGIRILVHHLWPRGVSEENADLDLWLKDVSPSTELREWFGHDPKNGQSLRKNILLKYISKRMLLGTSRSNGKSLKRNLSKIMINIPIFSSDQRTCEASHRYPSLCGS